MKAKEISVNSETELPELARSILEFAENRKVFALYAQMGAGKTTLIKELCRQLGSSDNFSSPTYSIANEYQTTDGRKIYHLDLYRLNNLEEAHSIGIEDYISGNNYCFVEWPELIETLLPVSTIKLEIKADEAIRHISLRKDG